MIKTIDIRINTFPGGFLLTYNHENGVSCCESLEELKDILILKLDSDLKNINNKRKNDE